MATKLHWKLLHWLTLFLFYVQPGVDRSSLMWWLASWFPTPKTMVIVVSVFGMASCWFGFTLYIYFLYHNQFPWINKYRIQEVWAWDDDDPEIRERQAELIKKNTKKFIEDQIFNLLTFTLVFYFALQHADEDEMTRYLNNPPPWYLTIAKLMAGLVIFETIFYWAHRLLHERWYQYHKQHHEYKQTLSFAGSWGSLVDGIISLTFPGALPALLLNMHIYEFWMWAIIHIAHSIYDHCGYDFPYDPLNLVPFSGYARTHNYHHSHNVGNYGLYWEFWDTLMGTNKSWRKFQKEEEERARGMEPGAILYTLGKKKKRKQTAAQAS